MNAVRCAVAVALVSGAAARAEEVFAVDPKKSELVAKTTREGLAKGLAHNHVVHASEVSGTLSWEPRTPQALRISIAVTAASLVADDPDVRRRHGEPTPLSASDRKKVTEAMLGEQQLDAKRYPTITFVSSGARQAGDALVVWGELTLHGVTRPVSLPVKITTEGRSLVGQGRLRLRTSDFGIQPYSAGLGTIKNSDQVELVLRIVATR